MSSSFALFFVVMTVTLTMAISAADDVLGYDMAASQEMAAKTQGDEELTTVHYGCLFLCLHVIPFTSFFLQMYPPWCWTRT